LLGMRREHVSVVPPGIDPRYSPGAAKAERPLVVAVGRLVPVKRFDRLIRCVAELHERHPGLECIIIGEGSERGALEALRHEVGGDSYISLPGRVSDLDLVGTYRRSWVLASTSVREGWGMSVSEAAACGTPAVVSRIAGHQDAVVDGETGFLAGSRAEMLSRLTEMIEDESLRDRMSKAAFHRAGALSWDLTAQGTLAVLASEASRIRSGSVRARR
ncbi:MAG: glycosyltransferase, partial [Acidimicrobiales bacterium]